MPLFHWPYCQVLRNYACGDIIVHAENVEQAREIALKDYADYHRVEYDHEYFEDNFIDEDSAQEYAEKVELLKRDLAATPFEVTKGAVFVRGSS